MLSFSQAEEQR
jgi:multifunctional beta-oxidation protein